MGKTITFILLLSSSILLTKAQLPENSWIKPSQTYLKLTVTEDGIYQIKGSELQTAGWDLRTINPENIQIFYRGTELRTHVSAASNNSFKAEDTILFYGKQNDGSRDSLLYRNAERANPYHSLYSDESAYFLTVGNKPGRRIEITVSKALNTPDEPFHLAENLIVYDDQFSFNNIIGLVPLLQQSYFEEGEGRTGKYIVSDSTANFTIPFKNRVNSTDYQPTIEYRINGRSRVQHHLASTFTTTDSSYFQVSPFGFFTQKKSLDERLITNESVNLSLVSTKQVPLDWYSMTFIKAVYPQRFLMDDKQVKYFNLVNNTATPKAIRITDLSQNSFVWNISDPMNPIWIQPTATGRYTVDGNSNSVCLLAVTNPKSVKKITPISFRNFNENVADYLIITHESLLSAAKTYADYRASTAGGSYRTLITTTEELYNTFNFGESSPVALRQFATYMVDTQQPKHLLLIGSGVSFPDELRKNNFPNLVPTIGYPGSDVLISAGLGTFPEDVQAIPTGRLNVTKNEEVLNYLEKVKATEAKTKPAIWQKNILHLSGGQNENEIRNLGNILTSIEPAVQVGMLGGKVSSERKRTNLEIEPIDISKAVNDGLGMITFVGHGSANQIDLNIGYCSPPQNGFVNEGKYPIMFFNGCGVGNVFYRYNALSTDWLLAPKKGAIAVFANSFWSYAYPTELYLNALYNKLFEDAETVNLTLGEIQQATNVQLVSNTSNDYIKANVHQMVLQGDPALRIFPVEKPDYVVSAKSVFISSVNESQVIAKNDSIRVGVVIQNTGRYERNTLVPIQLKTTSQDGTTSVVVSEFNAIAYQDTVFLKIAKNTKFKNVEVVVNAGNEISEFSYDNNSVSLDFSDWDAIGKLTSFPENILPDYLSPVISVTVDGKLLEENDFVSASPTFLIKLTDNQTLDSSYTYHFDVLFKACETCNFEIAPLVRTDQGGNFSTELSGSILFNMLPAGTYSLRINARDNAGNRLSKPYEVRFRISDEKLPLEILTFPNPGTDFVQIQYRIVNFEPPAKVKLLVYNATGQLLLTEEQRPSVGKNSYYVNTKNLPSGRFFVKIISDEKEVTSTSFVVK